jgi:cytochrome c biogenesis protein CcdA
MLLALSVNLVEFGCTAILPAIYMSMLLARYGVEVGLSHILWTLFYALIYVLPLYAVLLNFMYVFKSGRISESQGRTMKLIGGFCMLVFGLVLLIEPTILSLG